MPNPTAEDRSLDEMDDDEKRQGRLALLRAIDGYWRLVRAEDEEGRRAFDAIAAWFADPDETGRRSFVGICRRLSLDPERIRADLAPRRGSR